MLAASSSPIDPAIGQLLVAAQLLDQVSRKMVMARAAGGQNSRAVHIWDATHVCCTGCNRATIGPFTVGPRKDAGPILIVPPGPGRKRMTARLVGRQPRGQRRLPPRSHPAARPGARSAVLACIYSAAAPANWPRVTELC